MSLTRTTELEQAWAFIAKGVDVIMQNELVPGWLTPEAYMHMYTAVHNFCVAPSGAGRGGAGLGGAADRTRHTQLLGGEMYELLRDYLTRHLTNLRAGAPGEAAGGLELILYYNACWKRYTDGYRYLNHIFAYLNRHWIRHEIDEVGRGHGVYEIDTLCLVLWRDVLFSELNQRLVAALLEQIEAQRNGAQVDVAALQTAIDSFVVIGLDDQGSKRLNLAFYHKVFEKPFFDATEKFYTVESATFLEHHGVVKYMAQVDRRLKEEEHRVALYLHNSTQAGLTEICEHVLILNNAKAMQGEFLGLLASDRQDDLRVLYKLLSKIPRGLVPIQDMLKDYVKDQGLAAVDRLLEESEGGVAEPRTYVETLLKVYDHFSALVTSAFEGSAGLTKAVEQGCEAFVNHNVVARPRAGGTGRPLKDSRTPELMAKFSDSLLKKSSKNSNIDDIEASLHGIVRILKFVDEKDLFENHYSRLLSRRLVHQNSANSELETSMMSQLGNLCGLEYVNKLNRMFQDMKTSSDMQHEFHKLQIAGEPDFNTFVLAEGFWPLPHNEVKFALPATLKPTFEKFSQYYEKKHNSRQLKWLWNFGKAEIKLNFTKSKAGYILQVSSYQMALLLAFNDADERSMDDFRQLTELPDEIIAGSLTYIVKAGVLLVSPAGAAVGDEGTSYRLNQDYRSKKVRINLNLPLKSDAKQQSADTEQQIEEDRKMFLQAIMVRIMKARRELSHPQLVQETSALARRRFQPTMRDIKRCIASLVEKEYLQRIDDDHYQYLA